MTREFTDAEAKRDAVPLLVGLPGPSGGGKTMSALRLATGMQRVTGGDIYFIDTESGRALHYADRFKFRHVPFSAPYGPLDYLAALEYVATKNPGPVIIDSMSHEHEGPGGVLESHQVEVDRLMKAWKTSAEKVQMTAWARPKADRRRLINTILQLRGNFIFCFRAKEKMHIRTGENPVNLGWMPIAGDEFLFEMTVCGLLLPGAKGVPTWKTDMPGERLMIKDPEQFSWLYSQRKPLDEATGEALAKWAAGGSAAGAPSAPAPPRDKPSRQDQEALRDALIAGGKGTDKLRAEWVVATIGRPLTSMGDLTRAEFDLCMQAAKEI